MGKFICDVKDVLGMRGDDPGLSMPLDSKGNPISMTRQSFAQDADINVIMSKYPNGGVPLDAVMQGTPIFGDFSDIGDFGSVVNRVNQARDNFMLLPAELRARFNNNVETLLAWVHTPENVFEAVKLQLLPDSMLEATFAVRPDLRPKDEGVHEGAEPKATPTPVTPAS